MKASKLCDLLNAVGRDLGWHLATTHYVDELAFSLSESFRLLRKHSENANVVEGIVESVR